MKFCPFCGTRLEAGVKFCPSCGKPVAAGSPSPQAAPQPPVDDDATRLAPTSAGSTTSDQPAGLSTPEANQPEEEEEEETRVVPAGSSPSSSWTPTYPSLPVHDEETRAVSSSGGSWDAPRSSTTGLGAQHERASASPGAAAPSDDASGSFYVSSNPTGYSSAAPEGHVSNDAPGYTSSGTSHQRVETPVTLSDGDATSSRSGGGSNIAKIAAAAVAVAVLGGGAAFAYNAMKGDDSTTSSSSQGSVSAAPGASGAAAPSSAEAKPAKMPDLKGKSIDEAQALLSSKVKIETSKTNLVEGMNGGAVISAQETAAGQATPDTVKVTLDQPANVTYVTSSSDLIVDSNPFSETTGQVANKSYEHMLGSMMSGYDDEPEKLELNLNRAYSRLRGDVAIDSKAADKDKTFKVKIRKDDQQIWEQTIKFGDAPKSLDLDVTNVLRLEIEVSVSGGTEDTKSDSSQLDFGDLRVLAEPGKGNYSSPASSS